MNFFKTVSVFLIAALANPLCCCFAEGSVEAEAATQHGCCDVKVEDQGATTGASAHDSSECPHSVEKESQISESADSSESFSKSLHFYVHVLPFLIETYSETVVATETLVWSSDGVQIPTTPIAQAYCVYLI